MAQLANPSPPSTRIPSGHRSVSLCPFVPVLQQWTWCTGPVITHMDYELVINSPNLLVALDSYRPRGVWDKGGGIELIYGTHQLFTCFCTLVWNFLFSKSHQVFSFTCFTISSHINVILSFVILCSFTF